MEIKNHYNCSVSQLVLSHVVQITETRFIHDSINVRKVGVDYRIFAYGARTRRP